MVAVSSGNPFNISNTALPAFLDPVVRLRYPLGGLPRFNTIIVHFIDLFKRQALGFRDKEVGEKETAKTGGSPYEEHLDFKACIAWASLDQVWGCIANAPVPEPVGGSGHRHSFGTDALCVRMFQGRKSYERIKFSSNNPSNRAPRSSEEEDIDTHEGDQRFL